VAQTWDTNSDAESDLALGIIKYTTLQFARLGASFALRIIRNWLALRLLAWRPTALPLPIRVLTTLSWSVWILLPLALLALVALFALRLLVLIAWVVRVVLHCFSPVWFQHRL
jgi:hypothetical protein